MSRDVAMVMVIVAVVAHGCIGDQLVDCANGRACPRGTVCATLDANQQELCLSPGDLGTCTELLASCTLRDGGDGRCYATDAGLVCLRTGCGNALVDPGEACDDGNTIAGDGCSATCVSSETCNNGLVDLVGGEQCDDGNRIGHDGCSSRCSTETPRWEPLVVGTPLPAFSHSTAYDSVRRRVVMFGGGIQGLGLVARGDTWEYEEGGWMRIPTTIAPAARLSAAMAYDPIQRRTVLFGGAPVNGTLFGDTWAWDGDHWTAIPSVVAPPPRSGASLVYDPETKHLLLFGGTSTSNTSLGDAWELVGDTWTELAGPLPPARSQHAMAYDPRRGVMVLVGDTAPARSVWERHAGVWSPSVDAPVALQGVGLAFDGIGLVTFVASVTATYRWDGSSWFALPGSPTTAGSLASLVADPVRGTIVLFGGVGFDSTCMCMKALDRTWEWDATSWREVVPTRQPTRAWQATAFDSKRGTLFFYGGGVTLLGTDSNDDLWELRGTRWTVRPSSGPPPLSKAAMAYDAARDELVLVGGQSGAGTSDQTWTWHEGIWTQRGALPARSTAAMAYDPVRQVVVLFGGTDLSNFRRDTWEWNGTAWRDASPASVQASRRGAGLAWDPIRRQLLMFGGDNFGASSSDLLSWNGSDWTPVPVAQSAPSRAFFGLAWNGSRRALSMFAGAAQMFTPFADTWELGASGWLQVNVAGPGIRQGHSMTPLADGSGVLAFGGVTTSEATDQLLRLRWDDGSAHESCAVDADTDGDGLAGCKDPDCWARCTPMCPPGALCEPSWPRCGDGTCDPREDCRLCPQDCTCPAACGDNFCDPGETCPGDCS